MALVVRSPTQAGRIAALCIRPFAIFFGLTGLGYRLLSDSKLDGRQTEVAPQVEPISSYLNWLRGLFPLGEELRGALGETGQTVLGGCVVGAALGLALGTLMRSKRLSPAASGLNPLLLAAGGPVVALSCSYWLGLRLGMLSAPTSLLDNPADALESLLAPSVAIGLMLAPGLAALVAAVGPYHEPPGLLAAASTLASRSESREGWRFGLPAGSLIAGVMSVEALWGVGLTSLFFDALSRLDLRTTLDVVAVLAVGGAGVALVVDVIGLRAMQPMTATKAGLRLTDGSKRPRPGLSLWVGGALATLWLAIAASGVLLGDLGPPDLGASSTGLFSDGHVLGTDQSGQDLLSAARVGLRSTPIIALVPALGAVILASGLVLVQRRVGALGEVLPGAIIDGLWWPQPVLVAIAAQVALVGGADSFRLQTLALMALGLTPGATRMLRREQVGIGIGGLIRAGGIGLFLAAHSLLAYFIVDERQVWFTSPDGLGQRLDRSASELDERLWPSLVIGLAMMLALGALYTLGAGLVRFGWQLSAATALAELGDNDETFIVAPTGVGLDEQPLRPGGLLETGTQPSFLPPRDEHAATLSDTPVIDLENPPSEAFAPDLLPPDYPPPEHQRPDR